MRAGADPSARRRGHLTTRIAARIRDHFQLRDDDVDDHDERNPAQEDRHALLLVYRSIVTVLLVLVMFIELSAARGIVAALGY
jgi:hypothetical protein